jgi:uncharacterized protein YjiS (DUF1127 family)
VRRFLTDSFCRNQKPRPNKLIRLSDSGGLYLLIQPTGARGWRFDYRFAGKRKTISFGPFPRVSVFEARRNRDLARQQLSQGLEPSEARKQKKREVRATFREIAQEWWNIKERELRMRRQTRAALNQLYDFIGDRPLDDIAAPSYCRPSSRYPSS